MRKALGIEFEGYTHPERFMILTTTDDLGVTYPGCTRNYITDPGAWFSVFKVSGDERGPLWRVLSATQPEQTDDELMNPDATERRLQAFIPKPGAYDIVHRNLYNVHQRVAASFRKGRVFLAGDSAHVNNPLGGLGLNFGIHDAVEVTTLLGQVIRREAHADILDQYDLHRRPLNIEFVQQQTIANKKRMEEKDPAARQKDQDQLRRTAEDPAAHRAYVRKRVAAGKRQEARRRGGVGRLVSARHTRPSHDIPIIPNACNKFASSHCPSPGQDHATIQLVSGASHQEMARCGIGPIRRHGGPELSLPRHRQQACPALAQCLVEAAWLSRRRPRRLPCRLSSISRCHGC